MGGQINFGGLEMNKKINWLLVGAGDIANKRVAPALRDAVNSNLLALCEPDAERRQTMAATFGIQKAYETLDEALGNGEIDAVYLATPVKFHVPQAIAVLEAKKSVLVEKPLGLDSQEVSKLIKIAAQNGKLAGCSYYRRASNRFAIAKAMIRAGELGTIVGGNMTYYSSFAPKAGDQKYWRVQKSQSGGGPLSDMATHMFDFLIGLAGMPKSVSAVCSNTLYDWEVEESSGMVLTLENGAPVTASFAWNAGCWRHEFELVGSKGRLTMSPFDSGDLTYASGRGVKSVPAPEAENVHLPLIQNFVDALNDDAKLLVPLEEALKTNLVLDAVYRSSSSHKMEGL